ncbi:DUF6241 domain-containing protein [Paucisalibacillus sp. EB02]|uniref:DUF6241 domain-containing protein n=1 Tax=Paucisalibacillus sp. EB02 TaxID=1347087 RepID=UPI0004B636E5|nr:DUF6241 domain-containing protein [Paucisalibacillus sp. EB02]
MNKLIVVLVILTILIFGVVGYIIYTDIKASEASNYSSNSSEGPSSTDVDNMRESAGGNITEEEMQSFKEKGLNPFGQPTTIEQLTDSDFQEYIHGMSHQKVKAEEKWGFYQINEDRIQWLLEGLNNNEFIHGNLYRRILEKWANGDFSSADDDHNAIWELQGGTVGQATGILSPEEERSYMESQQ